MATAQITLQVDAETARAFQNASAEEKAKAAMLLHLWLLRQRKSSVNTMLERMNEMAKEAKKNGLTEEILQEILADEE